MANKYHTTKAVIAKQDAIKDAAAFYGDTCADPELFSDADRARALQYLRILTRNLKKMLAESPLTPIARSSGYLKW
jgi:hypothetical protein